MFIGWDWGNGAHDVAVMDNDGRLVDKWKVTHTEEGLAAALRRLAKHEDPTKLPVAIEASRGLVVDRLLAAGHPVVPVDTRALDRQSYAHLFAELPLASAWQTSARSWAKSALCSNAAPPPTSSRARSAWRR